MKAAAFEYVRPATLAEAVAAMAADDEARVIAGGQTLVPMMVMRLARPTVLIDILRVPELSGIREEDGCVVIGAATRQAVAIRDGIVAARLPLLARALPWIGHQPTRNRGTIGGSIANADPSAEIPLVAVTLDARLCLQDRDGETIVAADDFFIGAMLTAIPPGAILKEVRFPIWSEGRVGVGFHEVSARRSDFAFASAAAQVSLDGSGACAAVTVGVGGAGERPVRLEAATAALQGSRLTDKDIAEAVAAAAGEIEAIDDLHASAAYRKRAAMTMARRALADARDQALEGGR
jgi:CO/xanthine dehydrogenase FAD-binding subunit